MDRISSIESGDRRSRRSEDPSSVPGSLGGAAEDAAGSGSSRRAWDSPVGGGASDEDDVERAALEANLTNLCFLHMRSWARKRDDFFAPLCLVASRELRRCGNNLPGAGKLVQVSRAGAGPLDSKATDFRCGKGLAERESPGQSHRAVLGHPRSGSIPAETQRSGPTSEAGGRERP